MRGFQTWRVFFFWATRIDLRVVVSPIPMACILHKYCVALWCWYLLPLVAPPPPPPSSHTTTTTTTTTFTLFPFSDIFFFPQTRRSQHAPVHLIRPVDRTGHKEDTSAHSSRSGGVTSPGSSTMEGQSPVISVLLLTNKAYSLPRRRTAPSSARVSANGSVLWFGSASMSRATATSSQCQPSPPPVDRVLPRHSQRSARRESSVTLDTLCGVFSWLWRSARSKDWASVVKKKSMGT